MARRGFKDAHTENRNYWSEVFFEQHLKQVAVRGKAQQTSFVSFNRQFKISQPGRRWKQKQVSRKIHDRQKNNELIDTD